MQILRTKWEKHKNKQCRTLHLDVEIPPIYDSQDMFDDEHPDAKAIREALNAIHGVESCHSHEKYQIGIVKGAVFGWDEVAPRVESALAEVLGMRLKSKESKTPSR